SPRRSIEAVSASSTQSGLGRWIRSSFSPTATGSPISSIALSTAVSSSSPSLRNASLWSIMWLFSCSKTNGGALFHLSRRGTVPRYLLTLSGCCKTRTSLNTLYLIHLRLPFLFFLSHVPAAHVTDPVALPCLSDISGLVIGHFH